MIELAALAFAGVTLFLVVSAVCAVALLGKAILWILLLPFRLLSGLVFLPMLVLQGVVGGLLLVILAPIVLVVIVAGILAAVAAVLVPLLPLAVLVLLVYLLVRASRPALAG